MPAAQLKSEIGSDRDMSMMDGNDLICTGNFEDQIAVFVLGAADKQAAMVEKFDLSLKNGTFFFHHLQGDIGPAATDFVGCDLQVPSTGQGHRARLTRFQIKAFTAEQTVGGIVEHGLQFADMSGQLPIHTGVIARGKDRVNTDPTGIFGQQ